MPNAFSHWIAPLSPVVLMLTIVIMNHVVIHQRNERKTASEALRFAAALAAEMRAMLDLYKMNFDLIEQKADYLLSTRSSIAIYRGNLGRLTALLERPAIERVVEVFAKNERIEAVVAAHSNLKCNLTYQFSSADSKFDEWKKMYEEVSQSVASACRLLEAGAATSEPLNNAAAWRAVLDQFFDRPRNLGERRWSAG